MDFATGGLALGRDRPRRWTAGRRISLPSDLAGESVQELPRAGGGLGRRAPAAPALGLDHAGIRAAQVLHTGRREVAIARTGRAGALAFGAAWALPD